jgi:ribonuclease HI
MSRKEFELFLYKNKYNQKNLIDIIPELSCKTISNILFDLEKKSDASVSGDKNNQNKLYVYTDGGCKSNGKKNARAAYSIFFTDDIESNLYPLNKTRLLITEPTNQKAELTAIKQLFSTIVKNAELFQDKEIIVCTDSMYSINCIEKWSKTWQKNDWKTAKNEPVKNMEIIQDILRLKNLIHDKITFQHVFSHTVEPSDKKSLKYKIWLGNNIVDSNINKLLESNVE